MFILESSELSESTESQYFNHVSCQWDLGPEIHENHVFQNAFHFITTFQDFHTDKLHQFQDTRIVFVTQKMNYRRLHKLDLHTHRAVSREET